MTYVRPPNIQSIRINSFVALVASLDRVLLIIMIFCILKNPMSYKTAQSGVSVCGLNSVKLNPELSSKMYCQLDAPLSSQLLCSDLQRSPKCNA